MTDVQQHATEIHDQFSDTLDISVEEVEERLETLVNEYRVPAEEARRSVTSSYLDKADMDREELGGDSEERTIESIELPEQWVDLTVEVLQLWEPMSESVAQVGLLGDETGTIKFTAWATSDLPELDEGGTYRLENLVTDEYEGRFSVKLNRTTSIEEIDEEIDVPESGGTSEEREIAEIDTPEEWVDLTAKVSQLWEPRSESIAQVGLLGDPSGTIKFTKWATSDLPELDEGGVYQLTNLVTDEYEGRFSVKLNRTTGIEELDEELEVGDDAIAVEGALVDIQRGSGLIKRCPEDDCTRVLQNGRCSEHGEVEGEFDLRVKAVIDDGNEVHETIFNQEATEELTDITLDEAKEMAMDALDTTVVADEIRGDVLGSYYRVEGPTLGRYVLANEFEKLGGPTDAEETLIKARSL
ncbi:replication factor A [Halococcus thailandensis JCM 13552]|uniref:Replication factor A n=1 Tax=Halococcus thailandensis JCM 13552 TaxID=1227457 RepID=M0N7L7_9EURY|nr:replication factor A [Halococcus thailandensis JCM 13552]